MLEQSCIWRTDRRPRGERDCIPIRLKGFKGIISILKVKSSLPLPLPPTARTGPFEVGRVTERAGVLRIRSMGISEAKEVFKQVEDASEVKRGEVRWAKSDGEMRQRRQVAQWQRRRRPTDPGSRVQTGSLD